MPTIPLIGLKLATLVTPAKHLYHRATKVGWFEEGWNILN